MRKPQLLIGLCCSLMACQAAQHPAPRPLPQRSFTARLQLADGTPIVGQTVEIRCGKLAAVAHTDERGRFTVEPSGGRCRLIHKEARLNLPFRASSNLLRGSVLPLVLPPKEQLVVQITPAGQSEPRRFTVDETLPHSPLLSAPELSGPAIARALRQGNQAIINGHRLQLLKRERRAWMPLAFRPAPPRDAITRLPLMDETGSLIRFSTEADRTIIHVPRGCYPSPAARLRLERLTEHSALGLAALTVSVKACATHGALRAGNELLWALNLVPGDFALVDRRGQLLRRSSGLPELIAFLQRSWPPFSATRQVSVVPAISVKEAAASRLLNQAEASIRSRRLAEAHSLLDQTLQINPQNAEARRRRALVKAKLGDVAGAMREVTWWRTSFGEEAAETLMEEMEQVLR